MIILYAEDQKILLEFTKHYEDSMIMERALFSDDHLQTEYDQIVLQMTHFFDSFNTDCHGGGHGFFNVFIFSSVFF